VQYLRNYRQAAAGFNVQLLTSDTLIWSRRSYCLKRASLRLFFFFCILVPSYKLQAQENPPLHLNVAEDWADNKMQMTRKVIGNQLEQPTGRDKLLSWEFILAENLKRLVL
jgi:hypothetical protein